MATIADIRIRNIAEMSITEAMSFVLDIRTRRRVKPAVKERVTKRSRASSSPDSLSDAQLQQLLSLMQQRMKKG
jgi:uncharacterized protein (UPF0218 family)